MIFSFSNLTRRLYNWCADGSNGMVDGSCPNRGESSPMSTSSRSLVLMNYFPTNPNASEACVDNSAKLISMMKTCYTAAGKRWPNFIAVDFYKVLKFKIIYYVELENLPGF